MVLFAALLFLRFFSCGSLLLLFFHGFVDDFHEVLLESLFLEHQSVLIPNEVWNLGIPAVLLHAPFEQTEDEVVVRFFCELQLSAVVHEFLELVRMSLAQLVNSDLQLLLLDVVVLFVLGATRETLPG